MFDIGFSEILVIGVVALVVIGPERLPKVARVTGRMLGQFQRYVNSVKAEIDREMQLEELKKLQGQVNDAARGLEESMRSGVQGIESSVREVEAEVGALDGEAKAAAEEIKRVGDEAAASVTPEVATAAPASTEVAAAPAAATPPPPGST